MQAFVVTPGFEDALVSEIQRWCRFERTVAPGVVLATPLPGADDGVVHDPVFARQRLPNVQIASGVSVRALAEASFAAFEGAVDVLGQRDDDATFTLHAYTPEDSTAALAPIARDAPAAPPQPGLASRVELVGRELLALLQQRRRRAFRRFRPAAAPNADAPPPALLLQILALGREQLLLSAATPRRLPHGGTDLAPWPGGSAPVATDRALPSRAYQKLEEAFQWMGDAPRPGQLCVDLGAAPGGWTMTALRRGARVIAVDRSGVDEPAASDPRLVMTIGNAFTYAPPQPVDWLLCDVICEPPRTLALLERWLSNGWCRNLVCTVKFKGRSNYGLLSQLAPLLLGRGAPRFARVKQLRHNKNEVTVMGADLL